MQLAAYVLHSRPYKESSALVDFFTAQGRIRAVLRAARGIVQRDFTTTPFIVAAAFYLIMTLVLTYGFQRLEKKYAVYDE